MARLEMTRMRTAHGWLPWCLLPWLLGIGCSRAPAPARCPDTLAVAPDPPPAEAPSARGAPPPEPAEETPAAVMKPPVPRTAEEQEAFNAWARESPWAGKLPELVTQAFADTEVRSFSLTIEYNSGEARNAALVTVVVDGYLDDSVRGAEHTLEFVLSGEGAERAWVLTTATERVRCWPGRGHTELAEGPCL